MSAKTDKQRGQAIAIVESEISRRFPAFGRQVGVHTARRVARKLGIKATIRVGSPAVDSWAEVDEHGIVTVRERVPLFVVIHELAHVVLHDDRVTAHGYKFLEKYVDLTYAYHGDSLMARAMEAGLRAAK